MPLLSRKNQIRPPLLLLAVVEFAILFSSIFCAGFIKFGSYEASLRILHPILPKAATLTLITMICMVAMGLYQFHQRLYFRETAVRVLVGVSVGSFIFAAVLLLLPAAAIGVSLLLLTIGYSLVLILSVRFYFVRIVDENIFRRKTLIYGAGERATAIDDLKRKADRRGFKVVARVRAPGDQVKSVDDVLETNGNSITDFAFEFGADEIVVAMDDRRGNLPIRDLLNARLHGIDVIDLLEFLEREAGKIRVDLVNPGWLIFSPGFRTSRGKRLLKRLVDLSASLLILLVAAPVMLFVAIAIKLEEGVGAPVFYRQVRVGRGNKNFDVLKFRSMRTDAEADGKAVWAQKNDDRVTRVGRVLRKSRLDELPQILNVLRGSMSLVGPRPERPEFVAALAESIPYYSERHLVNPGITGWAQLRYAYGASEEDAMEKLQYDLYYIKNHNFVLDLIILLQTVEVVLWGKGAR